MISDNIMLYYLILHFIIQLATQIDINRKTRQSYRIVDEWIVSNKIA